MSERLLSFLAGLSRPQDTEYGRGQLARFGLTQTIDEWPGPTPIVEATVRPERDGTFTVSPDGQYAFVLPVWEIPCPLRDGPAGYWPESPQDALAFLPGDPGRSRSLYGTVLIGEDYLSEVGCKSEPAVIYGTLLEWLQAEGRGAVVLDWDRLPVSTFWDISRVLASDHETAKALTRFLAQRVTPSTEIRTMEARHAA